MPSAPGVPWRSLPRGLGIVDFGRLPRPCARGGVCRSFVRGVFGFGPRPGFVASCARRVAAICNSL
eukprot:6201824-Lingulodinium_polyedra.AAC.1